MSAAAPPRRDTPQLGDPVDPLEHQPGKGGTWWRYSLLFGLLYFFLVAIKLLEGGISGFGEEFSQGLLEGVSHPLSGLAAGILFTVLVQSSSVTTSTIVALVGAGTLTVEAATPMIMGANIGTTITNTLVSIGHARRGAEFNRAFAAATVHDFFNLIAVAVMLPIEIATGFLSKTARLMASQLSLGGGGSFTSPIKTAVKSGSGAVKDTLTSMGLEGTGHAILMVVLGLGLIFLSLTLITRNMRRVIALRAERALNRTLKKRAVFAIAMGALVTMAVQSSSITTSLMVPMCGSGILTLEAAFPVMLGANIGTTITAFLASLATDVNGLQIALVHMMFNLLGVAAVYPFAILRRVPIRMAQILAVQAVARKVWVLAYVGVVFLLLPILGILLF